MNTIYKLGFIPKEDDFVEFSKEDYADYEQEVGEVEGKMFTFKDGLTDAEQGVLHSSCNNRTRT